MVATEPNSSFPSNIADGVRKAVDNTFTVICGERPAVHPVDDTISAGACVAGSISFIGDLPWSYTLVLSQTSAPALAKKYFGMDVAFDSADMGDVVGELANVLAGDVVAQLENRGIKVRMSLPIVARGSHLEFMPDKSEGIVRLDYLSPQGPFWLRLMTVSSKLSHLRASGS